MELMPKAGDAVIKHSAPGPDHQHRENQRIVRILADAKVAENVKRELGRIHSIARVGQKGHISMIQKTEVSRIDSPERPLSPSETPINFEIHFSNCNVEIHSEVKSNPVVEEFEFTEKTEEAEKPN